MSKLRWMSGGRWYKMGPPKDLAERWFCCDCGLAHTYEFRTRKDGNMWVRATRDRQETAEARKARRYKFRQR